MKRKCDNCGKPATHHSVEIIKGEKIEKHLCDSCAADEGLAIKAVHTPINELLTNFVKLHSGAPVESKTELACDNCGTTFEEFRQHSLLGCSQCYSVFEEQLAPLIERAHESATHHIGKVPQRAGDGEHRQQRLLQVRRKLNDAVDDENYELAAKLRDEIRQFEEEL